MSFLEDITGNKINSVSLENLSELKHVGHLANCAVTEEVTKYFVNLTNGRVILVIENNSIGKSIVEQIQLTDMGYYLYNENISDINN